MSGGLRGPRQGLMSEVVPLTREERIEERCVRLLARRLLKPGVRQPGMGAPLGRRAAGRLFTGRCDHCGGAHRDENCWRNR